MGVIQRQSIKYTLINFVATFVGFFSVIFIYPLDMANYGYFQLLYNFASLLIPVLGLGIHGAIIKFYPVFVQKGKDTSFLSFTLVLATIAALLSSGVIALLYTWVKPVLYRVFDNFTLVDDNKYTIWMLGALLLYITIFVYHAMSRYRIVIPDMINSVGIKIFLPVLIWITWAGYLRSEYFASAIILYFTGVAVALMVYVLRLGNHGLDPGLGKVNGEDYRQLFSFMGFSVFNALGASLALRIDLSMIGAMLNKEAVGVYGFILTISNVMEIPNRAINQIASPVISSSWANGNRDNIQDVYQKSTLYGLLTGLFLFMLIFFIWSDVLMLMPKPLNVSLQTILLVFSFLGCARIIDLMTGVNSIIISYSQEYKYHMYFLMLLGISNLVLNYFLLKQFGLPGVAFSTLLSYLLFNGVKYYFVKRKFGLSIHFKNHIVSVLAALMVFSCMIVLPFGEMPIINIILKPVLVTVLFGILIWWINPGGEIRGMLVDQYSILRHKLRL